MGSVKPYSRDPRTVACSQHMGRWKLRRRSGRKRSKASAGSSARGPARLDALRQHQPEQIAVRGFPPPLPLWGRYLTLPGEYALNARREGYHPLHEFLTVGDAGYDEFRFELQPLPALFTLSNSSKNKSKAN